VAHKKRPRPRRTPARLLAYLASREPSYMSELSSAALVKIWSEKISFSMRLEETRETARRELDTLEDRLSRIAELEHDRDTLLATYTEQASRGLDYFIPEDRHQAYKRLRLSVLARPGGDIEVSGVLGEASHLVKNNGTSRSTARKRRKGVVGCRAAEPARYRCAEGSGAQ
jgi:hypothetical protein